MNIITEPLPDIDPYLSVAGLIVVFGIALLLFGIGEGISLLLRKWWPR